MQTKTPAPVAAKTPTPVAAKPRDSFVVTLTDAAKSDLAFKASRRKDGSASSYILLRHRDASGKVTATERGGNQNHLNLDAAIVAIEALVKTSEADGWKRRTAGGGYRAKPEAFTASTLPKPKK